MRRFQSLLILALFSIVACGQAGASPFSTISAVERFQLLKGACASGDERAVEILLERGADPNGVEDWKEGMIGGRYGDEFTSPLTVAAIHGHIEILKLLMRFGAVVDVLEGENHTPLSMAIGAKQTASVRFLLNAGADPTKRQVIDSTTRCDDPEIRSIMEKADKRQAQPGATDNPGDAQ